MDGLRGDDQPDPDPAIFLNEHAAYIAALRDAGVAVTVLPALEEFPDSVFIEDAALCRGTTAIALRPGAPTRRGEAAALRPDLNRLFDEVIDLPGAGHVDGGDVLLTETEALVGLSARTDQEGVEALSQVMVPLGLETRIVDTPADILHFKTECGLLDDHTIFATERLARSDCFNGYDVIVAPADETAAANLIRVNDRVFVSDGYPKTATLLRECGFDVVRLATTQAARVDGGLSCMSLRYG